MDQVILLAVVVNCINSVIIKHGHRHLTVYFLKWTTWESGPLHKYRHQSMYQEEYFYNYNEEQELQVIEGRREGGMDKGESKSVSEMQSYIIECM